MLNKKSLLNRTLVGAGVFVCMAIMVLLDILLPSTAFSDTAFFFVSGRAINSVIISAIILLAVVEMRRALGTERIPDCFSWLLWLYGFGFGISYSLFGYTGVVFITMLVFIAAAITSLRQNCPESLIYIAFMLVYPGMFLASLLYINRSATTRVFSVDSPILQYVERDIWSYLSEHRTTYLLPTNAVGLAFVFVVSSFTDVFAYFIGSLFGKRKLCPQISPKKTVEGAVGGICGGVIGSFLLYLLFEHFAVFGVQYGLSFEALHLSKANVLIVYSVIGLLGSVATQIGDLLASHVKRYCGIKDYSRILGEHGGIMDRFDGIMMNSVLVATMFMFIL